MQKLKNYRAHSPQNLALTKILQKIQENEHTHCIRIYFVHSSFAKIELQLWQFLRIRKFVFHSWEFVPDLGYKIILICKC